MHTFLTFLRSVRRRRISERRWRRLAHTVTRETFLEWLADQAAKDMVENKPSTITIEQLIGDVHNSPINDFQYHAERFIEKFYHNYPFYDETFCLTQVTFRQMIQQKLRQVA